MFHYISFLRPPPTQTTPTGTIAITPQVSNDLRTEPCQSPRDIYYSWTPYVQPSSVTLPSPAAFNLKTTKPAKLTTYRHGSAYKEIPVPAPPGARDGEYWHLILSSFAQSGAPLGNPNYVIDMRESDIGILPFPVISMPILFSAKGLGSSIKKKQEKIERIYRISRSVGHNVEEGSAETEELCELKITEQTSFDLDKKIWDSGIGLGSWLVEFQTLDPDQRSGHLNTLWNTIFSKEPCYILELGAGTGIVSIAVAALRSQLSIAENEGDKIVATDLDTAIPLLTHNISSNTHLYPRNTPVAGVLDWDQEALPESISALGSPDVIVMSDVTYNTSSFPALLRTVARLIRLGDKSSMVLLGYKERDRAERDLWEMMEDIGLRLEKVGERQGVTEPAVEIWLGRSLKMPS